MMVLGREDLLLPPTFYHYIAMEPPCTPHLTCHILKTIKPPLPQARYVLTLKFQKQSSVLLPYDTLKLSMSFVLAKRDSNHVWISIPAPLIHSTSLVAVCVPRPAGVRCLQVSVPDCDDQRFRRPFVPNPDKTTCWNRGGQKPLREYSPPMVIKSPSVAKSICILYNCLFTCRKVTVLPEGTKLELQVCALIMCTPWPAMSLLSFPTKKKRAIAGNLSHKPQRCVDFEHDRQKTWT